MRRSWNEDNSVPEEVRRMGFNWAALVFCLSFPANFVWIAGHGIAVWIGLLQFIPIVHVVVAVWLGFRGYEMAWKARQYESIEEFRATELQWQRMAYWLVAVVILWAVLIPMAARQ